MKGEKPNKLGKMQEGKCAGGMAGGRFGRCEGNVVLGLLMMVALGYCFWWMGSMVWDTWDRYFGGNHREGIAKVLAVVDPAEDERIRRMEVDHRTACERVERLEEVARALETDEARAEMKGILEVARQRREHLEQALREARVFKEKEYVRRSARTVLGMEPEEVGEYGDNLDESALYLNDTQLGKALRRIGETEDAVAAAEARGEVVELEGAADDRPVAAARLIEEPSGSGAAAGGPPWLNQPPYVRPGIDFLNPNKQP